MADLVFLGADKHTPLTDSYRIAKAVPSNHRAVIQLIRQHIEKFNFFGRVAFEMRPFDTAGGTQKREVAILNEQQSMLLICFMKNTETVIEFKIALVKAFYEMRSQLEGLAKAQSRVAAIAEAAKPLPSYPEISFKRWQIRTPKGNRYIRMGLAEGAFRFSLSDLTLLLNYAPQSPVFRLLDQSEIRLYADASSPAKMTVKTVGEYGLMTLIFRSRVREAQEIQKQILALLNSARAMKDEYESKAPLVKLPENLEADLRTARSWLADRPRRAAALILSAISDLGGAALTETARRVITALKAAPLEAQGAFFAVLKDLVAEDGEADQSAEAGKTAEQIINQGVALPKSPLVVY